MDNNVKLYLEAMEGQLSPINRTGKRASSLEQVVRQFIKENKPTTIKALKDECGFSTPQQVHSILTKSEKTGGILKRVKVSGRTLVIINEEGTPKEAPVETEVEEEEVEEVEEVEDDREVEEPTEEELDEIEEELEELD